MVAYTGDLESEERRFAGDGAEQRAVSFAKEHGWYVFWHPEFSLNGIKPCYVVFSDKAEGLKYGYDLVWEAPSKGTPRGAALQPTKSGDAARTPGWYITERQDRFYVEYYDGREWHGFGGEGHADLPHAQKEWEEVTAMDEEKGVLDEPTEDLERFSFFKQFDSVDDMQAFVRVARIAGIELHWDAVRLSVRGSDLTIYDLSFLHNLEV